MKITRLSLSNNAHKSRAKHYTKLVTSRKATVGDRVKEAYHQSVINAQIKKGSVLNKREKAEKYNDIKKRVSSGRKESERLYR